MQDTIDKSDQLGKSSIRLVQVSSNVKSFALYASMGFVPKEQLAAIYGQVPEKVAAPYLNHAEYATRKMQESDVEACAELYQSVNGVSRRNDIQASVSTPMSWVLYEIETNKIIGYTT